MLTSFAGKVFSAGKKKIRDQNMVCSCGENSSKNYYLVGLREIIEFIKA